MEDKAELVVFAHGTKLVRIPFAWVEVRHAPGYRDDGAACLAMHHKPEAVAPDVGVNGHQGTWTTVHAVYYSATPEGERSVRHWPAPIEALWSWLSAVRSRIGRGSSTGGSSTSKPPPPGSR
jgi:hypothetical protein